MTALEFGSSLISLVKLLGKRPRRVELTLILINYFVLLGNLLLGLRRTAGKIRLAGMTIGYTDFGSLVGQFVGNFIDQQYYCEKENDRPVIIDAGANIGISVLYFKHLYPGAQVIAFEPEPAAFALLKKNIRLNKLTGVVAYPFALGRKSGIRWLFRSSSSPASLRSSLFQGRKWKEKVKINCVRLSAYLPERTHLVKIDTEGAEEEILEDLTKARAFSNIQSIILEFHHRPVAGWGLRLSRILKILEDSGYSYRVKSELLSYQEINYQDILLYANADHEGS